MKSVLITGCNRGIGFGLINYLTQQPNSPPYLFATCRNPTKAEVCLIHLKLLLTRKHGRHVNVCKWSAESNKSTVTMTWILGVPFVHDLQLSTTKRLHNYCTTLNYGYARFKLVCFKISSINLTEIVYWLLSLASWGLFPLADRWIQNLGFALRRH
jgi:hypothetical protein